ncbi:MAG: flagellar hook-associated protein FlgK [Treponema sp.]|nr:flagellar hook-associated protein FlgK [Treponema sp.]
MTSTFLGLEIGRKGVQAHQSALNTIGHNLNNLETKGYSRQRVDFAAFEPIYMPGLNRAQTPGQIGQGVIVERIERIRDEFVDRRIVMNASSEGFWEIRNKYLSDMESLYLELGFNSIRTKMDTFWEGWQDLAAHPANEEQRVVVINRGKTLIDGINSHYEGLNLLQQFANEHIEINVNRINELTRQIASLNGDIQRIKGQGDNPNDLMDRRNVLIDDLAKIIDITMTQQDPDEFMIHTSGHVLVQGQIARQFDLRKDADEENFTFVYWRDTGSQMIFNKGELGALFELRDVTIEKEIQNLNNMTMNFADLVNEIHSSAYGANGRTGINFFIELPYVTNVNGNYDRSGNGFFDSSYIYRINGQNTLEPRAQPGLEGTITLSSANGQVQVQYYSTDTVDDIIKRINNSGAEVVARLNREGQIQLKGTPTELVNGIRVNPDFVIRHIEDSGHFLTGYAGLLQESGAEGAFRWDRADAVTSLRGTTEDYAVAPVANPSGWITVNPELFKDHSSVAAGFGVNGREANPGNGDAAAAIASIRNNNVMIGKFNTFDDYFSFSVTNMGELKKQAGIALATAQQTMDTLRTLRSSISGVNLNEELTDMIRFQKGYEAVARYITTVNNMLDTIINRMGV